MLPDCPGKHVEHPQITILIYIVTLIRIKRSSCGAPVRYHDAHGALRTGMPGEDEAGL